MVRAYVLNKHMVIRQPRVEALVEALVRLQAEKMD